MRSNEDEIIQDTSTNEKKESLNVLLVRKKEIENRLHGFRFKIWQLASLAVMGGLLGYAIASLTSIRDTESFFIPQIIIGTTVGCFTYFYFSFLFRYSVQHRLSRINLEIAALDTAELKNTIEENFFTKLVQINFKYIDTYYLQTQEQADKSFKLSTFASISGLIIITIGIIMMYTSKTEAAYVTTAAGVLSQSISAIFFYLYNKTVLKMSHYHQKLVLTQNISLALKITEDMEKDAKSKAQEMLIDRLTLDVNKFLTSDKE